MAVNVQQKKLQDLEKEVQLLQAKAKDTASGTHVEELTCLPVPWMSHDKRLSN